MSWPSLAGALFSKLNNDAALTVLIGSKIYSLEAAEGTALPYVIFYVTAGLVPNIVPRETLNQVYSVESRATTRGLAEDVHQAVYAALHKQTLTISGWTNYWMACERAYEFSEQLGGVTYYRFVWDIRISASKDN